MVKVIVVLVIVVKRVFSLAKTIVVDVIVIYIPRIPVVFFVMGYLHKVYDRTQHNNLIINPDKITCTLFTSDIAKNVHKR